MSRVINVINKLFNKNHIAMILVLMIIFIIPFKANAVTKDYSKFDWDKFYEANKNYWSSVCDKNDKECHDEILYYQKMFYTKLYKLLADYQKRGIYINDDIILTTAFFELIPTYGGNPTQEVRYKDIFSKDKASRSAIKIDDDYNIADTFTGDEETIKKEAETFNDETDTHGYYNREVI